MGKLLTMDYAIEIKNLKKIFFERKGFTEILRCPFKRKEGKLVLYNVNLGIEKGSIFCLLGPNGAGKTTLIKIICTLILPTEGKVFVNGVDVEKEEWRAKGFIGLVTGEERSFFWRLSGRENLLFFASLYNIHGKKASKKVSEVLEIVRIDDPKKRYQEYSGGMKQRLGIARALLGNPEILLMDEPTKSLDPIAAEELRKFLKEKLCRELKTTIFFTTHQLNEAEKLASKIAIINKGEIKVSGTLDELMSGVKQDNVDLDKMYAYYVNS